jgi:lipopolysaccharide export system protein LptA
LPDRITTSHDLTVTFNDQRGIASAEQAGDFRYQEGQRTATADRGRYIAADEMYELTGSPRISDSGVMLTADSAQINRRSGNAYATGSVKATYNQLRAQPGGAMLATADPIHVTGTSMTANRNTESAKFTDARLWQTTNVIEAPALTFDRKRRSLLAQGSPAARVTSTFLQPDKSGKSVAVNVTADRLSYVDGDRKALFSGNVVVGSADATITADTVQAILSPRSSQSGGQMEKIVAQGNIQIQQKTRRAVGDLLVYTSQEEKFVLTASGGKLPSIFDAERGQITGDSLTFFTHDDRVLVESTNSSHSLSETKAPDASKK